MLSQVNSVVFQYQKFLVLELVTYRICYDTIQFFLIMIVQEDELDNINDQKANKYQKDIGEKHNLKLSKSRKTLVYCFLIITMLALVRLLYHSNSYAQDRQIGANQAIFKAESQNKSNKQKQSDDIFLQQKKEDNNKGSLKIKEIKVNTNQQNDNIFKNNQNTQSKKQNIFKRPQKKPNDFPLRANQKPVSVPRAKKERSILQANITSQSYQRAIEYLHLGFQHPSLKLIQQQKQYMENKYHLSKTTEELPICVVLPSYNNAANNRYKFNLKTILDQEYKNYHIVYVDDGSIDNTSELAQKYLQQEGINSQKYVIVKNKQRKGALFSERMASKQFCKPHELYFLIDGDDGLVGTQVFKLFNHMYQQNDVWFIYGNFIKTQYGIVGSSRRIDFQLIDQAKFRRSVNKNNWPISHLKTFYNQLFLKIQDNDLMFPNSNQFFDSSTDRAIVYPMLQMMRDHNKLLYIPEIVYLYNDQTQLSVGKVNRQSQIKNLKIIQQFSIKEKVYCLFKDEQTNKCIEPRKYSLAQNQKQNIVLKNK